MLQAPRSIVIHLKCFDYPIAMYFTVQLFKLSAVDLAIECYNAANSANITNLKSILNYKNTTKDERIR